MAFRWFGVYDDSVKLNHIGQIPCVNGIVSSFTDIPAGDVWPIERIANLKDEIEAEGLKLVGIESVNVHESIKLGLSERDHYIDNYIQTLQALGESGVHLVCYNFMPLFDWLRTDLFYPLNDGSTTMAYQKSKVDRIQPQEMVDYFLSNSSTFSLPGWEKERLRELQPLLEQYQNMSEEMMFTNYMYFIKAILPVCEQYEIHMGIHPDDPAWPVFHIPRIAHTLPQLQRLVQSVDHPCNGITLCTGSLATSQGNDIATIISSLKGKIPFVHVRNIHHDSEDVFWESSHLSKDGDLDMVKIIKALQDSGFDGVIRPDHGRMIWGEAARPGYGLYDRALGAMYLYGIWETLQHH